MDLTDWESPNPGLLHVPSDDAEWGSVFGRYAGTTNDGPLLRCIAVARENGAKSVVVTFDRHPASVVRFPERVRPLLQSNVRRSPRLRAPNPLLHGSA